MSKIAQTIANKGKPAPLGCYIYTRVSTEMQVEGYSLDAQKKALENYANYKGYAIKGYYSDEGKSGKSIKGRPAFQTMLDDIVNRKDDIAYVLVYKLSRFGRNAADVLNSLQLIMDMNVNLYCLDDGLDSSSTTGKLMITIFSGVAEMERENIRAQTTLGRREKASRGLFNGGLPPYGYTADEEGKLRIVPEEANQVKMIFERYVNTNDGFLAVAMYFNDLGIVKSVRSKADSNKFTERFVKKIIDNPVYIGKMTYGRTKVVDDPKAPKGKRRLKNEDYIIANGQHEAIISEELWNSAQLKREQTKGKKEKLEKEHEYILSGLLKCPKCGKTLYGVPMRKRVKRKDGSYYPTYYAYSCRQTTSDKVYGKKCDFGQLACSKIDTLVRDIILSLTMNEDIKNHMSNIIDTETDEIEIRQKIEHLHKEIRNITARQHKLEEEQDNLDIDDTNYDRKYESISRRLDNTYDELNELEIKLKEQRDLQNSIKQQSLSAESIGEALKVFNKVYDLMSDKEKKDFLATFISSIELYDDKSRKEGCSIKQINFKFPVNYQGESVYSINFSPRKEHTAETVVLMSRVNTLDK